MVGTIPGPGASQWPNQRTVEYRLAGRLVTREMNNDALAAKRAGLRVMVTTPGIDPDAAASDICGNCGGLGLLYLQSIIAGPFRDAPAVNPANGERAGTLNGKWYKMTLKSYPCPTCSKTREVQL